MTVVLSGMNRDNHLAEKLRIAEQAAPGSLSKEEAALVAEAADAFRAAMKAGCSGCQYCMPDFQF
jgi:predicted aldo/keto reductase-like oxidoreductase